MSDKKSLEERVSRLASSVNDLGWKAKIAENVMKEIREIAEEYTHIDGAHHKQYALVRIARLLDTREEFDDEGIPA